MKVINFLEDHVEHTETTAFRVLNYEGIIIYQGTGDQARREIIGKYGFTDIYRHFVNMQINQIGLVLYHK